jgi:UDP-2-acetamido-3-amino-2,3-dideoxy-glucuronate N-acetyltransferase
MALYMPTKIWGIQYKFSHDAVLTVLASEPYSVDNYVKNYKDFLKYTEK